MQAPAPKPRPPSRLSIRWILPAAVVAPVLAVAVVLTLLAYRTGQRTANDLAGQSIRQIHARIEGHLNRLMDLPPAINQLNRARLRDGRIDRKSTRLNSSHSQISYAVFCLKKKKKKKKKKKEQKIKTKGALTDVSQN